uniref:Uncharacterized protein n=1 Tax=Rhizophora mucronata TaxID=61149 RepID=A0A2P2MXV2_RHIMU
MLLTVTRTFSYQSHFEWNKHKSRRLLYL